MNYYKKLEVWKEAMILVTEVYQLTKKFPKEELYALTSQIKRCSVSIPSNIAEGAGRNGRKEFISFLGIAGGSCCELDTQLILAERLGYLDSTDTIAVLARLESIKRMNVKLIQSLKSAE
jgi:four helix bundle protein